MFFFLGATRTSFAWWPEFPRAPNLFSPLLDWICHPLSLSRASVRPFQHSLSRSSMIVFDVRKNVSQAIYHSSLSLSPLVTGDLPALWHFGSVRSKWLEGTPPFLAKFTRGLDCWDKAVGDLEARSKIESSYEEKVCLTHKGGFHVEVTPKRVPDQPPNGLQNYNACLVGLSLLASFFFLLLLFFLYGVIWFGFDGMEKNSTI